MKIWTITTDNDGGQTSIRATQAEADALAVEIVTAWWGRYVRADDGGEAPTHEDWKESYSILCDTVGFMECLSVEQHDLSEHPAVKEARATLYLCMDRLDLNDIEGEEQPFITDCETAIAMLDA